MEDPRSATPPHQPLYGVKLSEDAIKKIATSALPEANGSVTVEKEEFTSFNNRIYSISCGQPPKKYILKVNGRFFGGGKIENEVGCLLLQETFCPSVPVPRVRAWSTGPGKVAVRNQEGKIVVEDVDELKDVPGWILMTRLPGKPLDVAKLTAAQRTSVIDQMVRVTLCWRRNIPWSAWAGDIRLRPHHSKESRYGPAKRTPLPPLYVYDISGMGQGRASPMGSILQYWQLNLRCLLDELATDELFAPNRKAISTLIEDCITHILPRLSILQTNQANEFVFTHADLAPRNILVSDYYPSVVTGILDFEFCGFFPTWSQFFAYFSNDFLLNEEGTENPDWPVEMYKEFVRRLAGQGVATPYGYEGTREWKELANLMRLEMNIAPWWMGGVEENEREHVLEKARRAVEEGVERLKSLSAEGI